MIKYTNKYTDKSFDIAKCRESADQAMLPHNINSVNAMRRAQTWSAILQKHSNYTGWHLTTAVPQKSG